MLLHVLMEEASMEPVARHLVNQTCPSAQFVPIVFQGKQAMLRKLENRLRGYRDWPEDVGLRVVVLVDRDDDDCHVLKSKLEQMAHDAGLSTLTEHKRSAPVAATRIVIEELESWFFGDAVALRKAFPRLPESLGQKASYRDPDNVRGGTAERLAKELQLAGYFPGGVSKMDVARRVAPFMSIGANRSRSLEVFVNGVRRLSESSI